MMSKKLSADLDLSYFSFSGSDATISYTYVALSADYYFMREGKGLYGGLGLGIMNFSATEDVNGGTAKGSASFNTINLKIGGKHGGLFYFRWELGYRVALNNATLVETATYPDGTPYRNEISLPVSGGGILADIGFGFSF